MKNRMIFFAILIGVLTGCAPSPYYESTGDAASVESRTFKTVEGGPSTKTDLSDGPGIAMIFNSEYNDNDATCADTTSGNPRGLYYCSGVLLRTVDNGNFNPWEYSPTSISLGGISFSWIRHDKGTSNLYHRAGFVLLSPQYATYALVPGIVALDEIICVYPFDAWTTRTMNRNYGGCDFEGTGFSSSHGHWGSCDNRLGYITAAQWDAHFTSVGQVNYKQCSWSGDNPQGWNNMIESRRRFSGQHSWTEVMLRSTAVMNPYMRGWATAFFYDVHKSGGLADARIFQQKMANTGKRVAILRLDFTAPAASRFQYVVTDQVTYP